MSFKAARAVSAASERIKNNPAGFAFYKGDVGQVKSPNLVDSGNNFV